MPVIDQEAQSLINLGAFAANTDVAMTDPGLVADAVALVATDLDPEQTANTASLTADQTNINAGSFVTATVEQAPGAAQNASFANHTTETTAANIPPVLT